MQRCWEVIDAQVCDTLDRMHIEKCDTNDLNDDDDDDDIELDSSDGAIAQAVYMQFRSANDNEAATPMSNFTIVNQT